MTPKNTPAPEMVPLPRAPSVFGISRSSFYRLAALGQVRLVKHGARTLVDAATVRSYLAKLPALRVRQKPRCVGAVV